MDRTLLPNATQFPDVLTDQVMPLVTGNEWKVIHYGVRLALGHRAADTLTVAQFAHGRQLDDGTVLDRGTGLSEDDVKECLAFLCDDAHIFLREDRPRRTHGYRLNLDFSSINWAILDQRGAEPQQPSVSADLAPVTQQRLQPPRKTGRSPRQGFVESPTADVTLGDADRPVVELMHERLTSDESVTFDHLLALAGEKGRLEADDMVVWQLFHLWRTYGFRRLQNAFQSPAPITTVDDVNHACLVGALADLLESERFGPITPNFREQLVELAHEWPRLSDWQQAVSIAVRINRRRLQTVETILKDKATPDKSAAPVPAPNGDRTHERSTASAQGRKRPVRRKSEWTEEELRAGREADRGQEWTPPPD
jgi:hypothetical protein